MHQVPVKHIRTLTLRAGSLVNTASFEGGPSTVIGRYPASCDAQVTIRHDIASAVIQTRKKQMEMAMWTFSSDINWHRAVTAWMLTAANTEPCSMTADTPMQADLAQHGLAMISYKGPSNAW